MSVIKLKATFVNRFEDQNLLQTEDNTGIFLLEGLKDMGLCVTKSMSIEEESTPRFQFSGGNVHSITGKENWDEKISEASNMGKVVIVNFSAKWCGPCRNLAPFYQELSEKYSSLMMFLVVDVDDMDEFSSSWDIKATPTLYFLKDGKQVDKHLGGNRRELESKINTILNLDPVEDGQK